MKTAATLTQRDPSVAVLLAMRLAGGEPLVESENHRPYNGLVTADGLLWAEFKDQAGGVESFYVDIPDSFDEIKRRFEELRGMLTLKAAIGEIEIYDYASGEVLGPEAVLRLDWDGDQLVLRAPETEETPA